MGACFKSLPPLPPLLQINEQLNKFRNEQAPELLLSTMASQATSISEQRLMPEGLKQRGKERVVYLTSIIWYLDADRVAQP